MNHLARNNGSDIAISPVSVLKDIFGYDSFRGQQEEIINAVINGDNLCVLMPTGAGKSLCYQIPALCMKGVGVIVSPLIALMQDQVLALKELGVNALAIHSGLEREETAKAYQALRRGELDLIYVAPERLMMDDFLDLLDGVNVALFAIDEAHCVSQWGHDFRPEYQQLSVLRTRFPNVPCIAVTATADTPTRNEILERLQLDKLYTSGFDRPNIQYHVTIKNSPKTQLMGFLESRDSKESGIVYCLSRKRVDDVASWLCEKGYHALPYHAGLNKTIREENQNRFLKEEGVIMVATIAFGMGIDKPDVRFVVHMDLPKNIESYYQETGRAGRDGLPSVAWMIYGMQDVALQGQMIDQSYAPDAQKRLERGKLNAFLSFCEASTCRRQVLLRYFGDESEKCGNCDTCLEPPETFDGTVAAQKALSCIYRTNQIFGSGYIIDVLLGKNTERVVNFGHDKISTYGIGTEYSKQAWQSILRQLLATGLIHVDLERHGSLLITQKGADFLKNKDAIELRLDKTKEQSKTRSSAPMEALDREDDRQLFEALRTHRLDIAKSENIPPYVIFHDRTLIEMAIARPDTLTAMSYIGGVGKSKLRKYGDEFLEIINDYS